MSRLSHTLYITAIHIMEKKDLFIACKDGDYQFVSLCLDQGVDVNKAQDAWPACGGTPLHVASSYGQARIVSLLLERGTKPDINSRKRNGRTPLHLACADTGNTDCLKVLIGAGADIHMPNKYGITPLHRACSISGNADTVKVLLTAGADIDSTRGSDGYTPLHLACLEIDNDEIVKVLLTAGADIHTTDNDGDSPLHLACTFAGNSKTVKVLLTAGANSRSTRKTGHTPFHVACMSLDNTETIKVLLTAGADILTTDNHGDTPLHLVCRKTGNAETVQVLLTAGADVHTPNRQRNTPLHQVCVLGDADMLQCLLNNGADMNTINNMGQSPLFVACKRRYCSDVYEEVNVISCKVVMALLFKGCYMRNILKSLSLPTFYVILYWAGYTRADNDDAALIANHFSQEEVRLNIEILFANFRLGSRGLIQFKSCLSQTSELILLMKQLNIRSQTFPTLKEIVRSKIREMWSQDGCSILGRVSSLTGVIPRLLIDYIFLYGEACVGLPLLRADIEQHFKHSP